MTWTIPFPWPSQDGPPTSWALVACLCSLPSPGASKEMQLELV